MHDVSLVDVDDELEGVAQDEDEDDSDQNGCHGKISEEKNNNGV